MEPSNLANILTSPTPHVLQITRCATMVQWQSQVDAHTMDLAYYRNSNEKGVVNDTTVQAQKHDVSTHTSIIVIY